jgi:RalA-binding protein 1
LGSITITGAQIGRQQRSADRHNPGSNSTNPNGSSSHHDDEKEYRHAFLIVEAKKGPGGSHPRHVLCAESDEERDAWVEMLVRYFTGTYSEDPLSYSAPPPPSHSSHPHLVKQQQQQQQQQRGVAKDEISISKGVPISQLQPDPNNAKLFSTPYNADEYNNLERSGSPVKSLEQSSSERHGSQFGGQNNNSASNVTAKRVLERLQGLPSSLPDSSSMLSGAANTEYVGDPRPNSEMGNYSGGMTEMVDKRKSSRNHSPERYRTNSRKNSLYPSNSSNNNSNSNSNSNSNLSTPGSYDMNRSASPDKMDGVSGSTTKVKISAPIGGQPIPSGFKFGKEDSNVGGSGGEGNIGGAGGAGAGSNRRDKGISRFWPGAWRQPGEKLFFSTR